MKSSMHSVMKSSGYAAGSLLTVADLSVVEVAAILAATDRMERMAERRAGADAGGATDCAAVL